MQLSYDHDEGVEVWRGRHSRALELEIARYLQLRPLPPCGGGHRPIGRHLLYRLHLPRHYLLRLQRRWLLHMPLNVPASHCRSLPLARSHKNLGSYYANLLNIGCGICAHCDPDSAEICTWPRETWLCDRFHGGDYDVYRGILLGRRVDATLVGPKYSSGSSLSRVCKDGYKESMLGSHGLVAPVPTPASDIVRVDFREAEALKLNTRSRRWWMIGYGYRDGPAIAAHSK